jgi:hypothetical protein
VSGRRRPEAWLLVFIIDSEVVTNHWGFGEDHFSELEISDKVDGLCSRFVDIQRGSTTLLDYRSRCAMYE